MATFTVVGSPISHSLSPKLHQAAFSVRGLEHEYESHEVTDLANWLSDNSRFSGLSVTMPLKEQALALAADTAESALETAGANTLVATTAGWLAHNTDAAGIQFALRGERLERVVVVGSGATARSAFWALRDRAEVLVLARDAEKSKALAAKYGVGVGEMADLTHSTVVSTVPAGTLIEFVPQTLRPVGLLLDAAYHPWPSQAALLWQREGRAISGIEMLIGQAVEQQRLFDSTPFELDPVLSAMRAAVGMEE